MASRWGPSDEEFSDPTSGDDEVVTNMPARTDDHWRAQDTDEDVEQRPRRPRRGLKIAVPALVVAVLASGTGLVLHAQERAGRTPQAAVEAYVQLIASGDVEAATSLVPIPSDELPDVAVDDAEAPPSSQTNSSNFTRVSAPALISDSFYAQIDGITAVSVDLAAGGTAVAVGETADVALSYSVGGRVAITSVRVERLPDEFPALPRWRVLDSLTVPVIVDSNDPLLGVPSLSGEKTIASDIAAAGADRYATMVYPGQYDVTFDGGPWFEAPASEVRVAAPEQEVAAQDVPPVTASISAMPSIAAYDEAAAGIEGLLVRCASWDTATDLAACPEP